MAEGTIPVEEVIATTLGIPRDRVVDTLAFEGVREWDSLGHVTLMVALESTYGVEIDEDRMVELTNISAIRSFIVAHEHSKASAGGQ